jgi:hypothetical protein
MRLPPIAALALGTLAACGPTTPDTGAQPSGQVTATTSDGDTSAAGEGAACSAAPSRSRR